MAQETSAPAKGTPGVLSLSALAAVAVHAGLLFGWNAVSARVSSSPVVCNCVDVALVDAANAPAEAPVGELLEAAPQPAAALPAPAATEPLPAVAASPEPVAAQREAAAFEPQAGPSKSATVAAVPARPLAHPPLPREPVRPSKTLARAGGGGPGASDSAPGAPAGAGAPSTLGKPVYLLRPVLSYPAESRAAGEQGVVVLRITVNAGGRPVAVRVGVSSGFSRLDRAAVEGGWRCRVSNAFEGAQFEAPLRFSLKD
jgi:protein TonB